MVGFLLALNAMLLTVPERRRFVADLRLQGYDWRQIVVLLAFQAAVLGVAASAVGVLLGEVLSRAFLHRIPAYLTTAFPIGSQQSAAARHGRARGRLRRARDDARVAVARPRPAPGPSERRRPP